MNKSDYAKKIIEGARARGIEDISEMTPAMWEKLGKMANK